MTKIPDPTSSLARGPNQRKHNAKPVLRLISHSEHERHPQHHDSDAHAAQDHPAERMPRLHDHPGESRRLIEKRIADESRRAALNPELHPNDPRWILATQTIQSLQGPALNPAKRVQLLRKATKLGIRPFDANLVIAIVQDQARLNTSSADACAFKFKNADLADRLQIIPRLGVPSIRNLSSPPASPPPTRMNPILRFSIFATATLALTAALLTILLNWFFNTAT